MHHRIETVRERMAWGPATDAEERASAAVHAIGAVLAAAALVHLVTRAAETGSILAVFACAVYGLATFATMSASTLFHSAPRGFDPIEWLELEAATPRRIALPFRDRELRRARRARRRRIWLALDHCAIFAMIAGTYTPILLLAFPHPLGASLAAAEWALAGVGIAVRLRLGRLHWTMIPVFLAMGWFGFLWGDAMFASLGAGGGILLLTGGLVYTAGLVPYLWRALPFSHALWHAFVVGGAACHYVVVANYVLPAV
jgi:hemolysin III